MKTLVLTLVVCIGLCIPFQGCGQYCIPTTAIPYSPNMPGLTLVNVNNIVRTSQAIENYPNNSYVNTGLSTTMVKGETYPVTLSFSLDAQIAPHMNLRIWIDLNHDGQLDDPGETLLSVDHRSTTYVSTITIPADAMTGTTRMRVTAKMCSHGGHSLPTPCDMPADILGYHGEIEDYEVNLVDAVGIDEHNALLSSMSLQPNPTQEAFDLQYVLQTAAATRVDVLDLTGRQVMIFRSSGEEAPGPHTLHLDCDPIRVPKGMYVVRIQAGNELHQERLVIGG